MTLVQTLRIFAIDYQKKKKKKKNHYDHNPHQSIYNIVSFMDVVI